MPVVPRTLLVCYSCECLGGGSWRAKRDSEKNGARKSEPARKPLNFEFSALVLGSVSSRECLDAPAILATFTAGRTGLVACP